MRSWATVATICALFALTVAGPAPARAQSGIGFRFAFGFQEMTGDMGDVLDGNVDAELSVLYPVRSVRLGIGANWVSLDVADEPASWSQVRGHLLLGYPFQVNGWLRFYGEGRLTYRRLRPEDDRYFGGPDVLLRDFSSSGSGMEGVLGAEIVLMPTLAIDLSGAVGSLSTSPDLSDEGFGPVDSGATWRVHVGLVWFPTNR